MDRNVLVAGDAECVSPFDPLFLGSGGSMSNNLSQHTQLIKIWGVPDLFVFGVAAELFELQGFASLFVKDWYRC